MEKAVDGFDIAVFGGGIAGVMAACAASRMGARTILLERFGFLGGTLVASGVGPMMTFHSGDTQIIRGLVGELVSRLVEKGLSPGHIPDTTGYTFSVTPFDTEGLKQELEQMALECGVKLLYGSYLCQAETKDGRVVSARYACKGGLDRIEAPYYVDATGDADLCALAGFPTVKPRRLQPATMVFKMTKVDTGAIRAFVKDHPSEFPRLDGRTGWVDAAPRLSLGGFVGRLKAARDSGRVSVPREDILLFETNIPGEVIVNTTRIPVGDPTDAAELTRLAVEGRRQVRELASFLKDHIPGFGSAELTVSGPEIGIRASRQIEGLYTLSGRDVITRRRMRDAVAHSAYPVDMHRNDGAGTDSMHIPAGDYYDIPLGALLPRGAENLIVAGRCLSADYEAQAAVRTSPTVGAMGQAAGCAAALAAASGTSIPAVDIPALRRALKAGGAWLPER